MILYFLSIRFILFFQTFPKIVSCHSNLMICFYVYFHRFFSYFVNLLIFTLLSLESLMSWQQMINNCSCHSINIYISLSLSFSLPLSVCLSLSLSLSLHLYLDLSPYLSIYLSPSPPTRYFVIYIFLISLPLFFFSYSSLRSECRMDARKLADFGRVPWGKYVFIESQIY